MISINKLFSTGRYFSTKLLSTSFNRLTPIKTLNRNVLKFCSIVKEQIPVNVVEENNSWSYEFNESEIKGVSYSPTSGNYIIIYTCKVCETRQSRSFTKNAYHTGVVIVRCEGCQSHHLIADNLKWFEESNVNVEDLVKRDNNEVVKIQAEGELKEYFFNKLKKREDKTENDSHN